jgi:hypothetical protein
MQATKARSLQANPSGIASLTLTRSLKDRENRRELSRTFHDEGHGVVNVRGVIAEETDRSHYYMS